MLWDLLQQTQISSAQRSANEASLKASITEINILELQGQVQTLALASQALTVRYQSNLYPSVLIVARMLKKFVQTVIGVEQSFRWQCRSSNKATFDSK